MERNRPSGKQKRYYKVKCAADRVLAGCGLVVLSPVLLGIAAAIKAEEGLGAPVFFRQKRVGIQKTHFTLIKFRSMKLDTPHDMPTHLLADPEQYLTRIGKWLRKTSLDELPQLWNIFRGDMAVVGPRPALWNQYDLIEERDKYGANDVKPGLTGWAQVHGRDELEIEEKAKLDGYYVDQFGWKIDIVCLKKTVSAVLKGEGVVEGGTGTMHCAERKKKKLLIITNHSYMLWQFRRELIAELQKEHEVVLSTPFTGHEEDFEAMGVRCIKTDVDRRGINPGTDVKLLRTYDRLMKQEKPDQVILYSIKPNIYAGWVCRRRHIPYYANVQGLGTAFQKKGLAQLVTLLYQLSFKDVQMVFFENKANAEEFFRRNIVSREKMVILHGAGVNLEHYAEQPYPDNPVMHFLYLGRIMKEKGMDELFAAVRRLRADGFSFVLDLAGFFEDEYKGQVEQLERDGIAVFHGFQEDPRPYYAKADCIVMPSYHEGMSNVILEAAAMGRAVITSDIPGCREGVEHGKTGMLCKAKDADSLYLAMKKFLELPSKKREQLGRAARRKMEREFDKKDIVAETVDKLTK